MKRHLTILTSVIFLLITYLPCNAQILWGPDGIPLRQYEQISWVAWSVKNNAGDIYVVWEKHKDSLITYYCQKYDDLGQQLWDHDVEFHRGESIYVLMCVATDDALLVTFDSPAEFGAPLIRAQKIDVDGNLVWNPVGVPIGKYIWEPGDASAPDGSFTAYNTVPDDDGGLYVIWPGLNAHADGIDLYAKHLQSDGSLAPGWTAHGNLIFENVEFISSYSKVSCEDGSGGFYVAYAQYMGSFQHRALVQHVDPEGNLLWGETGMTVTRYSTIPLAAIDGTGGVYLLWPQTSDLLAQRFDFEGNALWETGGIVVCVASDDQYDAKLVYDEQGGFCAAWTDERNSAWDPDIYAQRISSDGTPLWAANGMVVTQANDDQQNVDIAADGSGGMFATWDNWEDGSYSNRDCYIQHFAADGNAEWQANGIMLSGGDDHSVYTKKVINIGNSNALWLWWEGSDDFSKIMMQKTDQTGAFQFPGLGVMLQGALSGSCTEYDMIQISDDHFLGSWSDTRDNDTKLVYYQIFDIDGNQQLDENGWPVYHHGSYDQRHPKAAATGDGGAIISWWDDRVGVNPCIFTQKIDATGNILWNPEGVRVTLDDHSQMYQFACTAENGGCYVSWEDYYGDIWLQQMSAAGERLFGSYGINVSNNSYDNNNIATVPDGEGGAIVVYRIHLEPQLYAARVTPTGSIVWRVLIHDTSTDPQNISAIPAQEGGAIIAWDDFRDGYISNIYAQKIGNDGVCAWVQNGVPVVAIHDQQSSASMAEDEDGNIYFAWRDSRGPDYNVYCQRLNAQGEMLFNPGGVPVSVAQNDQVNPKVVSDGQGGALIAWTDERHWNTFYGYDIYGTHLDAQGQIANPFWQTSGSPICQSLDIQMLNNMIPDGYGGAVASWAYDFRVQRINDFIVSDGGDAAFLNSAMDYRLTCSPNPFNPTTVISFQLSAFGHVKLAVYDIAGRKVATLVDGYRDAGSHEVTFDGSGLASGIYLLSMEKQETTLINKMVLVK